MARPRRFDIIFEVQHWVLSRIAFLRRAIAEPLPWPAVQFRSNPIAIVLGEVGHALALGEILAEQAVGVLVRPPFPRVVRGREVEAGGGGLLECDVLVKLGPVVDRDGPHEARLGGDELPGPAVHCGAGALLQLSERQIPGFALDHAEDAGAGLPGAEHRVRLPMAHLGPQFNCGRARCDRALAGDAAPAVVASVALPAALPGARAIAAAERPGCRNSPKVYLSSKVIW